MTTFPTASRARLGAPGRRPGRGAREAGATDRGGDEQPEWPAVGGRGQGRAARRRRCGSFRRALRAEALRRAELPRPVAPVTGRMRYPPYLPGAAPVREDQAVRRAPDARRRESHSSGGGTPRIVRAGPSSVNSASHPARGTRLRRAVDPGASANPAGLTARARPKARPGGRVATSAGDGERGLLYSGGVETIG